MMKDEKIKKVLVIGSGPIIIGQAAEFDYSGSQACQALKEEGIEVVLVNSNPATIQTDTEIADRVYIEPLQPDFIEKIIAREKPDGLVATMGGQTGLNLSVKLADMGILEKYNVRLLGTDIQAIKDAEDRELFNSTMRKIGEPILPSKTVKTLEEGLAFAEKTDYPIILRPAYTLGGTGGGVAFDEEEFKSLLQLGLNFSPISQVLLEKSVLGWAEIEYEVMRDGKDNCITICNMENFDPMGIHTGESIVVAPSQTLNDNEYQMLRNAALKIVRALDVKGGCNVQFSLNQETGDYSVIEVNPRLSRSSALASKATGFPIARVAAKIALGYTLDEIKNAVTKTTPSSFEPALDYVVTKIPRWPFDKMPEGNRKLGTQMKSTGEVMSIGRTFEESLQKAIRSLEIKEPKLKEGELESHLMPATDLRLFAIFGLLRKGKLTVDQIHEKTRINKWFLYKIKNITDLESRLKSEPLGRNILREAKRKGFSDRKISEIKDMSEMKVRELRKKHGIIPVYKMVDTCAAEFEAKTPYYYSTYEQENESERTEKKKVIVIGGGPIRIGQGVEFDYCCCHSSFSLREMGVESIMINNNPETVSTDFDASDKLYFEPLTFEHVMDIIEHEKPDGVIVQFGGQTSVNLALPLARAGVPIMGTGIEGIDIAEDRERFRSMLHELGIEQPANGTATSEEGALKVAEEITYPVVVRPSYVIAGRGMRIIHDESEMKKYIREAVDVSEKRPVLIDKYVQRALEVEIDGVSDGENLFIGGIMEHVERAGVHSGDASSAIPPIRLKKEVQEQIIEFSQKIAKSLNTIGLINIQYIVKDDKILVLEANPRASRTIPYLSKAVGVPLAKIATKIMLGKGISDFDLNGRVAKVDHYSVKSVVFPFLKLRGVDFILGPEMKSTGESMGIDSTFPRAYFKALLGANLEIPLEGNVIMSLKKVDQEEGAKLAKKLRETGFKIFATGGTASKIDGAEVLNKIAEGEPNILSKIKEKEAHMIINTPSKGSRAYTDGFKIRRASIENNIPCITSLEAAFYLVDAIREAKEGNFEIKRVDEYGES